MGVLPGAGAQIWESVINLSFQFLLEREQQMLIFFWSSSSELLAIRGRFLLAGTTRTLAWDPRRKVAVQRRLLISSALWLLARGECWGMPGEFWNDAVLLDPLAGFLGTQGIPRVLSHFPSHTQVPQPPSLWWKSALCKFLQLLFSQLWPEWIYVGVFFLKSGLPMLQAYLWPSSHQQKSKAQYIKAECNNLFSWRLSGFPHKCRKLYLNVHLSGIWDANVEVIFMSLCFDLVVW